MNKEIEEMANVLCDLNCSNKCQHKTDGVLCQRCSAEALYNAGYRKIIWHKVADGDLPVFGQTVIAYDGFDTFVAYKNYQKEWYYAISDTPACGIIAWTELPTYKGEEQ